MSEPEPATEDHRENTNDTDKSADTDYTANKSADAPVSRWFTDTGEGHSEWYIERFRQMARDGNDLEGEARFIDTMVPRGSRLLDAGCGPGRVGGALHARGHDVVGVDVDPKLIDAAEEDHPGPQWLVRDLNQLDLVGEGMAPFDGAVMAGNVIAFVARGTEADVLRNVGNQLVPGGFLVVGYHVDRYPIEEFDQAIVEAGLYLDLRLGTWDIKPFTDESDFTVSILRRPL